MIRRSSIAKIAFSQLGWTKPSLDVLFCAMGTVRSCRVVALGAAAREVAVEEDRPVTKKSEAGLYYPLDKTLYISVDQFSHCS